MCRILLLVLFSTIVGGCQASSNLPLKELADARLPDTITVNDEWSGLSPVAPIVISYTLVHEGQNFSGKVNYSVGGYFTATLTDEVQMTVPVESVEQFLKILSESSLRKGEYVPNITWTDDYPNIRLTLEYESKSFEFSTESQGEKNIPWKLTIDSGTEYVINSGVPSDALQILQSFIDTERLNSLLEKAGEACGNDFFDCPEK